MAPKIILAHSRENACFSHEFLSASKPLIAMRKVGLAEISATASPRYNLTASSICQTHAVLGIKSFIDGKSWDIGSVVVQGLTNTLERYMLGDIAMMTFSAFLEDEALRTIAEICHKKKVLAVAVAVPTTLTNSECVARFGASPKKTILRTGRIVKKFGFDGIVCSANELQYLQDKGLLDDTFVSVVPGNRPTWATYVDEGGRTGTPKQIARWGADYTVVGRAVSKNPMPLEALDRIHQEMAAT